MLILNKTEFLQIALKMWEKMQFNYGDQRDNEVIYLNRIKTTVNKVTEEKIISVRNLTTNPE